MKRNENQATDERVAPAIYAYTWQADPRFPSLPEMDFYHLTDDIIGHSRLSTVSAKTLASLGYALPPKVRMNTSLEIPLDSIVASVPPVYKLNWIVTGDGRKLTPSDHIKIQIFPGPGFDTVQFKFWGFDNYDVHVAFPELQHRSINVPVRVSEINYQITVIGEADGPSISSHYRHQFKFPDTKLTLKGLGCYRKLFQFYNALEHMPKLPNQWQYLQFVS